MASEGTAYANAYFVKTGMQSLTFLFIMRTVHFMKVFPWIN